MEIAKITKIEDNSVKRKLEKLSDKLKNKYCKKRKINEWILREKSRLTNFVSAIINIIFIFIIMVCGLLCISTIISRLCGTTPTFAGYSLMQVSSGSMESSGFYVGDKIVVFSVDTDTLRVGDKIAFYVYKNSYEKFNSVSSTLLDLDDTKTKKSVSFASFLGMPKAEIKSAATAGSIIVFHQIMAVYEDENGERWFETQGTSNGAPDSWKINENYVLGAYDNSHLAIFISKILNALTNNVFFILLIVIPFLIFSLLLTTSILKDVQVAKLELDVVEEKRKLTDDICVRNQIGYLMDTKTKYKVLAQANDDNKKEYLSLLWKDGAAPESIKKYLLRKEILLAGYRRLLELNRTCEQMFKAGEKPAEIAKFYMVEKGKIETKQFKTEKKLKKIKKNKN